MRCSMFNFASMKSNSIAGNKDYWIGLSIFSLANSSPLIVTARLASTFEEAPTPLGLLLYS
jgi:hypothetical protein